MIFSISGLDVTTNPFANERHSGSSLREEIFGYMGATRALNEVEMNSLAGVMGRAQGNGYFSDSNFGSDSVTIFAAVSLASGGAVNTAGQPIGAANFVRFATRAGAPSNEIYVVFVPREDGSIDFERDTLHEVDHSDLTINQRSLLLSSGIRDDDVNALARELSIDAEDLRAALPDIVEHYLIGERNESYHGFSSEYSVYQMAATIADSTNAPRSLDIRLSAANKIEEILFSFVSAASEATVHKLRSDTFESIHLQSVRGRDLYTVDIGNDGDRSNDVFIDSNGRIYLRTPDILNRTPAQEQLAQDNLDWWRGVFGLGPSQQASASGGSNNSADRDRDHSDKPSTSTGQHVLGNVGNKPASATKPILLDLDGDGIEITELDRSTVFMDSEGTGLKNRTAWAGAGDGVLFYDADNDGLISDDREYVFTEWDPTASDDLAALRSRFDTNGDGKLSGAELNSFKVMVTNADGSRTVQTAAALGITEIRLASDTTDIRYEDGSASIQR